MFLGLFFGRLPHSLRDHVSITIRFLMEMTSVATDISIYGTGSRDWNNGTCSAATIALLPLWQLAYSFNGTTVLPWATDISMKVAQVEGTGDLI